MVGHDVVRAQADMVMDGLHLLEAQLMASITSSIQFIQTTQARRYMMLEHEQVT